ncbi:MAG TPA: hypothetical protein PK609_02370 [Candidatus Paceibacterota bacterium]|nr:hypothetical protein [Candidatus Paceibacterota bacterium]
MILNWDLYEIRCDCAALHGVKLRGRIRKFTLDREVTCLVENASDEENVVRFALITGSTVDPIASFITSIVPEASVTQVLKNVPNPVLSKLKVNDSSRYDT